ncbi:glycosyltransferase involved in cell wall biosynthesis [Alkalibacillus flavidus]|uniref:Glycosyltransferase involved in cell wall biosynthesis n=1 Tax=Alkalibacillus flavidus TaxID=546021 RepID=A0ABV2KXC6_9BACI
MKIMHVISGGETGGSKNHIISLLKQFNVDDVLLVVMQEGLLSREAKAAGVPTIVLGQTSRYDLKARKKLKRLAEVQQADVIHSHGARANLYVATIIDRLDAKWVTTVHSDPIHDFMTDGLKGKLFTKINLWTYSKVDHFFAVSERFKDNLVELGVSADRITTILNGIEFDVVDAHTTTRDDLGIADDAFVVTMVARLHPIKGHHELIEAVKQVVERVLDQRIELVLVGDGDERPSIEEAVREQGLVDHVHFLGFRDDIPALYRLSDVAILTSHSESFPLALLEAAREKTPLIATDVGGIRQLVEDYGWLIEPQSVSAIEKSIMEAVEAKKDGRLEPIGMKQYEHAQASFSLEQLANQTKETYMKEVSPS